MHSLRFPLALIFFAFISMQVHAQTVVTLGSSFSQPFDVATDSAHNVFVAASGDHAVKRILAAGGYTTVDTIGSGFSNPVSVFTDAADNVYVVDAAFKGFSIQKILAAGGYTTVQTLPPLPFLAQPISIALDTSNNIYYVEQMGTTVTRILAAGGYTTTQTLGSGLSSPTDVALDSAGNLYVACSGDGTVKRLVAADGFSTVQTIASGFQYLRTVAVDSHDDVYVNDIGIDSIFIKKLTASSGYTSVTALAGGFTLPTGIDVDDSGDVYVADYGSSTVKKILVSIFPTSTTVSSDVNPSVFRQIVNFSATVTGNNPTGTVNFFAGPNLLCGGPLVVGGNQATCSSSALLAMTHTITAVYGGDANNSASTSAPLAQTVNQATTVTSVGAPASITLGQPAPVTATLAVSAPGGGVPTGVISISDGSVNCSIVLPATSCSLTPTSIGTRTITASYGGDANYIASSNTTSLIVDAPSSSTTLNTSLNPSVYGQSVSFSVTVSGTAPTGIVNVFDGASVLCSNLALVGAQATCNSAALTVGAHAITAVYGGDINNSGSTSTALAQNVTPAETVTSVNAGAPIVLGQSAVVTATVAVSAPGAGTPTGSISISDGTVNCSIVLPASTCSLTPSSVGVKTITASYNGDVSFGASSSTAWLTVDPPVTGTVVTSDLNPSSHGQSVTFTATITGGNPTGTVDFLDGAMQLCSAITLDGAQASCASGVLATGTHEINANYSGDANNAASTGMLVQSVTAEVQTITVVAPSTIGLDEGSVIITAVASSGLSVTLTSETPTVCNVNNPVPFTVTLLTPGLCTLIANQAGDVDHAPVSVIVNLQVQLVAEAVDLPTLDRAALLAFVLMLGGIGCLRARRSKTT